jgi:hypothetical protein
METKYYKFKDVRINSNSYEKTYVGFLKEYADYDKIVDAIERDILQNTEIFLTENLVLFEIALRRAHVSHTRKRSRFANACLLGGIIFSRMSYAKYFVTATAKHVVEKNKIQDKNFTDEHFLYVHQGKLIIDKIQYLNQPDGYRGNNSYSISTKLENTNVDIKDMEQFRLKEIKERISELFLL